MPFLDRDGVKLYYEVHGDGVPLLLTHGFSATSQMWQGQISAFSKDFKLIVWDMRGHGRTTYPSDPSLYSEEHTVADMFHLLKHVCPDVSQAVIGGLSLGGYMSLAFYRRHPESVSKLLIIDTGPGFKKDSAREGWNRTAHATADEFEKNGLMSLRSASPERSQATHSSADGLVLAARGMLTQRNDSVMTSLPNIKVPSLIVVGSKDFPFLGASDYMAAKIPGARKVVIDGAGHAANIDRPEAFNRAIMAFLNDEPYRSAKL